MLYLFVLLKIPILFACGIVWWAVKQGTDTDDVPTSDGGSPRPRRPHPRPRRPPPPRRGGPRAVPRALVGVRGRRPRVGQPAPERGVGICLHDKTGAVPRHVLGTQLLGDPAEDGRASHRAIRDAIGRDRKRHLLGCFVNEEIG